jgi:hypothetical protein
VASSDNRRSPQDPRASAYLAKAQEAEDIAAKSTDTEVRASWQQIAEGYRVLAKLVQGS